MRSRLVTATIALLLVVPAGAAFADDPDGWVDVDEDDAEVEIGASDGEQVPGTGGGDTPTTECTWAQVPEGEIDSLWWQVAPEFGATIEDPNDYVWYWRSCPAEGGGFTSTLIPVPRDPEPVDPMTLRDEAVDRMQLPAPTIAFNPPRDHVVHVDSWLWIDGAVWRDHSKSTTAGGVTVTATASPQRVTWTMGNGDVVECGGPGTPYDPTRPSSAQTTSCSYTYEHSSAGQPGDAYVVTATIEWAVTWSVIGAPGGGPLPNLSTSSSTTVRVSEMQSLNQ